jgi:hypothetical protein
MKTPKGLKQHQSKNKSDLDLSKIMNLGDYRVFRDKFKSFDKMEKNAIYKGTELAVNICAKFAENVSGYSHFSELYDNGGEAVLKGYTNRRPEMFNPSSDDDDSSSSDSFDRGDHYEDIKDNFRCEIISSFQTSPIKDLKEFEELYKLAINKKAFTGTLEEFLKALKTSPEFLSFLGTQITKYSG